MHMRQLILMLPLGLAAGSSLAAPPPGQTHSNPNDPCSPYWQGAPPFVPCDEVDKARPVPGRGPAAATPRAGQGRSPGQPAPRRGIERTDIRRGM